MKRFALALFSAFYSISAQAHCNLETGYTVTPSFTRDCNFAAFLERRHDDEKRLFTGVNDDFICRDLKLEREYDRHITPQVVACYQWAAKWDLQSCGFGDLQIKKVDLSRDQVSKWGFLYTGVSKEEMDQREKALNEARVSYLKALAPKLVTCFTESNLRAVSEQELENLTWAFIVSANLRLIPNLSENDAKVTHSHGRGDRYSTYHIKFNGIEVDGAYDDAFTVKVTRY